MAVFTCPVAMARHIEIYCPSRVPEYSLSHPVTLGSWPGSSDGNFRRLSLHSSLTVTVEIQDRSPLIGSILPRNLWPYRAADR